MISLASEYLVGFIMIIPVLWLVCMHASAKASSVWFATSQVVGDGDVVGARRITLLPAFVAREADLAVPNRAVPRDTVEMAIDGRHRLGDHHQAIVGGNDGAQLSDALLESQRRVLDVAFNLQFRRRYTG